MQHLPLADRHAEIQCRECLKRLTTIHRWPIQKDPIELPCYSKHLQHTRVLLHCHWVNYWSLIGPVNGLGHLDWNFLRSPTPTHFASGGGDHNACHCNGVAPRDVLTVTDQCSYSESMTLYLCPNAVTGASYIIDLMGKVPYPARRFNRGMISSR